MERKDFEPTNEPLSLKELVREEVFGYQQQGKDGSWYPKLPDESLDDIMKRVYEKIEREALATYHSNAPWALRQWALSNILKEQVVDEATNEIAHGLISPVIEWQDSQPFDPIKHLIERLETERKSKLTIGSYRLTAARFVAKCGRKRYYTDEDILSYLKSASKHFKNQNTYHQECVHLLQFLKRLPEGKSRELPIAMPKGAVEFYQPTFSDDDVGKLIWACVLDNVPPNMVVRLAVASIYGARRGELTELSTESFSLDRDKSTLLIKTEKRGQRKPQPIPQALIPIFSVPITTMKSHMMQYALQQICRKAEVHLPKGGGFHCFRRRTATTVHEVEPSDMNVSSFMRWSPPRGMLARYVQTPVEQTDRAILEKHPFVRMWAEAVPYILKFNKYYQSLNHNSNTVHLCHPRDARSRDGAGE